MDPKEVSALVTGASRGIGAAIAEQLARLGHPVILNYRSNGDAARQVQQRIEVAGGVARVAAFDVADRDTTRTRLEELQKSGPPIGVVVNNAAVTADAAFPSLKPENWDVVLQTTLGGFYNVTQPLVMPMVSLRWGRIVNISSISGLVASRGQVNYSAAKAGLIGATRSLATELAKRNITVNAVAPGPIATDMLPQERAATLLQAIPMKRLGQPEEVAHLVAFLASDRAGFITGQVIGINGGLF